MLCKNKNNKEIIQFLTEKKIEVKSHMSTLTGEQEEMVRKALSGAAQEKPAAKAPASAEKPESPEAKPEGAAPRPQAPPKKKKIIAVYNVQNSQTGIKDPRAERRANNPRTPGARGGQTGMIPAARGGQQNTAPGGRPNPKGQPGNVPDDDDFEVIDLE